MLSYVVHSTKSKSNVEELLAQRGQSIMQANVPGSNVFDRPKLIIHTGNPVASVSPTQNSLIKGALRVVVLHGNHVVPESTHVVYHGTSLYKRSNAFKNSSGTCFNSYDVISYSNHS